MTVPMNPLAARALWADAYAGTVPADTELYTAIRARHGDAAPHPLVWALEARLTDAEAQLAQLQRPTAPVSRHPRLLGSLVAAYVGAAIPFIGALLFVPPAAYYPASGVVIALAGVFAFVGWRAAARA